MATLQSDVQVRMLALGDVIMYTECIHNYFQARSQNYPKEGSKVSWRCLLINIHDDVFFNYAIITFITGKILVQHDSIIIQ